MSKTSQVIDLFKNLNLIEMKVVRDFIKDFFNNLQINFDSLNEAEKNTNGLVCSHCNSTHYSKNGHKANKSGIFVLSVKIAINHSHTKLTQSAKLDIPTLEKYFRCQECPLETLLLFVASVKTRHSFGDIKSWTHYRI